jgi:hypothetical protein
VVSPLTFPTREACEKAIAALDGTKIRSRALRVNEAEVRPNHDDPHERPRNVSMKVENLKRVDDRPIGPNRKRVRYKGI